MAIPLVQFHDDGSCATCPEALRWLRALEDPVAVVAVAGRYRTGKSFLLNHVLLRDDNDEKSDGPEVSGFPVGPTTQPCTKGLWLWPRAARVRRDGPGGRPCHVLVIDTEGTGATNSNDTRDTRIFALALLLSSYFIYNSQGSIDEPALANLQVVTEVGRMVRVQAEEEAAPAPPVAPWNAPSSDDSEDGGSELSDFFPTFMWVVRDFVLEMRGEDGTALEESEYLEEALRCGRGGAAKDEIRQALLRAFPRRDCATLVRPCNDESKLRRLNTMPEAELRPEFVAQAARLRAKALSAPPKTVHGQAVTGAMLAALCESYTQAITQGGAPVIETAWTYVCADQCRRARKEAIQIFDKGLAAARDACAWPVRLELELEALRAKALAAFRARACASEDEIMEEEEGALRRHADAARDAALAQVGAAWTQACTREWNYDGDGGVGDVIEAWVKAMDEDTATPNHSAAGAAYVHASLMRSNVTALRRAASRRTRVLEEERARALQQLLEAQERHRQEAQGLKAAGARHQEECAALRRQMEAHAAEHREALAAQHNSTQKACEAVREESAAALMSLKTTLETRSEERQHKWEALTIKYETLQSEHTQLQEARQAQEQESAELAQKLEESRGAAERVAAAEQARAAAEHRISNMTNELNELREKSEKDRADTERQMKDLAEMWQERQAQAQQAARQVQAQLRQEADLAEEERQKVSEKMEEMALALQRARADLEASAQRITQKDAQLRENNHIHQAGIADIRTQHSAAMAKLHQQYNEKDQTHMSREIEQHEKMQDLKAQHSVLLARQEEAEGRLAEARSGLKRKREEVQELRGQQRRHEELRQQFKYLRASYDQMQKQHAALQKERDAAAAALEAAQREYMVEHSKLEIRCGTREEKIRELNSSCETLRAQLAKQTQEVQRLKKVFDSIKS